MDSATYNAERDAMRQAVLDSLDKWARDRFAARQFVQDHAGAGWQDKDLPRLFAALDSHFDICLARFGIATSQK